MEFLWISQTEISALSPSPSACSRISAISAPPFGILKGFSKSNCLLKIPGPVDRRLSSVGPRWLSLENRGWRAKTMSFLTIKVWKKNTHTWSLHDRIIDVPLPQQARNSWQSLQRSAMLELVIAAKSAKLVWCIFCMDQPKSKKSIIN